MFAKCETVISLGLILHGCAVPANSFNLVGFGLRPFIVLVWVKLIIVLCRKTNKLENPFLRGEFPRFWVTPNFARVKKWWGGVGLLCFIPGI